MKVIYEFSFSAVGTSSPSGTSDIGHVNAEELTDNSLAVLVEDTSKSVRRLELETQMFTGRLTRHSFSEDTFMLIKILPSNFLVKVFRSLSGLFISL